MLSGFTDAEIFQWMVISLWFTFVSIHLFVSFALSPKAKTIFRDEDDLQKEFPLDISMLKVIRPSLQIWLAILIGLSEGFLVGLAAYVGIGLSAFVLNLLLRSFNWPVFAVLLFCSIFTGLLGQVLSVYWLLVR